jgi:thymidine phosphorylase
VLRPEDAHARVRDALASGAALAKFREFVTAQGGDGTLVDEPDRLPAAPVRVAVPAPVAGYVQAIDSRAIGLAVVKLGGGRHKKGEPIDPRVGIVLAAKVGDYRAGGDPLCMIHAASEADAAACLPDVRAAFVLGPESVDPLPMVYARVPPAG